MYTSLSCVGRVAIVEESGWKSVFHWELYSLLLMQILNAKPSCVVPTAAFWSRARRSIVARNFAIFLRLVRLLLGWRASLLQSRAHFSTGNHTTRTSVVLSPTAAFYGVCDFVSNLTVNDLHQEIVRQTYRTTDVNKAKVWCSVGATGDLEPCLFI